MANVNITPELRSAKEKFLYFHDLTACNRICGAGFFRVFYSPRAFGSIPLFQSFQLLRGVLSRGVFASVLSLFLPLFLSLSISRARLSGRRSVLMNFAVGRAGL